MSTVRLDKHKVNLDKFYCEHSTYCEEDIRIENQEHLEQCEGFSYEQRGLDLTEEMGKQIFWRRMAPKLKKLDNEDKYSALKAKTKLKKEEQALKKKKRQ